MKKYQDNELTSYEMAVMGFAKINEREEIRRINVSLYIYVGFLDKTRLKSQFLIWR